MQETREEESASAPSRMRLVTRRMLQIGLPLAVVAICAFFVVELRLTAPEAPQRQARERSYNATVTLAEITDAQPQLDLFGELVATGEVELRSLVAGEIASVNPSLVAGGRVAKGDTLITISDFEYRGALAEARANLAEARAGLSEARARIKAETDALSRAEEQRDLAVNELDRARTLAERGTASTASVETAQLTLSQREQAVELRRNNLAIEEARLEAQEAALDRLQWRVEQAENNLANTVLTAPFDAVVEEAPVEAGRLVGVNDMVASLYDPASIEAAFTMTDAQYGRILASGQALVGRPVDVNWQLGDTSVALEGEVVRTAPRVTAQSGGVRVFARLAPDARLIYRPGAFVTVSVPDRTYEDVIALPEAAIYNTDTLYVVENDRLKSRKVEVVALHEGQMLVRGDIAPGTPILVSRMSEAGDGVLVEVTGGMPAVPATEPTVPLAERERPDGSGPPVRRQ